MKRKLILFSGLLLLSILLAVIFPSYPALTAFYDAYLFYPVQSIRSFLLGYFPFSVGDIIYVAGGAVLLFVVCRWVVFLIRFKARKRQLAASFTTTGIVFVSCYLWFFLGWGANYYKRPLREAWHIEDIHDTLRLSIFDSIIVEKLNAYAPAYRSLSIQQCNTIAAQNYQLYTDCKVSWFGQPIKPSFFSYFLERMAIDGYYNPFTGEGQISDRLPNFLLPFVISHEMAHQAGIAAEGDANLLAYALCANSTDSSFNYSGQLNIWLYVDHRLHRKDSVLAKKFESRLNSLTRAHLDTLDQLSKLYENEASRYGGEVYDSYLKMQHQKQGIKSYGNVMVDAWKLERSGLLHGRGKLRVE